MNDKLPQTEKDQTLVKAEKSVRSYQLFVIRLLVVLFTLWVLFFFVIGISKMPSDDMSPKIPLESSLIYFRLDKSPVKDDVMIYDKTINGEKEVHIGRVVATSGDTVDITDNGRLLINGNAIQEPEIFYDTKPFSFLSYPVKLKANEYFVLADKRDTGTDSRYFGPITKEDTVGTVLISINRKNL